MKKSLPKSHRSQDGCWNCVKCLALLGPETEMYACNIEDNRPPCSDPCCGDEVMEKEADSIYELPKEQRREATRRWSDWFYPRIVNPWEICDEFVKKEEP